VGTNCNHLKLFTCIFSTRRSALISPYARVYTVYRAGIPTVVEGWNTYSSLGLEYYQPIRGRIFSYKCSIERAEKISCQILWSFLYLEDTVQNLLAFIPKFSRQTMILDAKEVWSLNEVIQTRLYKKIYLYENPLKNPLGIWTVIQPTVYTIGLYTIIPNYIEK
jgi:hypothetical protein